MPRPKKNKQAGAAFKELLNQKGFSNGKLSKVTGIDKGHIGRIVNGETANPQPTTLGKIATALGIELGELTQIFDQSPVRSHLAEVPQPQEQAQEETPSKNPDFVGREEAIAYSSLENERLTISSANLFSHPPTPKNWQGRNQEIQQLTDWFADTNINTIGIQGLSGIGKSWLAAKVYQSKLFESRFWADVSQKPDFTVFAKNALKALTGKFSEEVDQLNELELLINNLLEVAKQQRCLLVIDNLETLLDTERVFGWGYRDFFQAWLQCGSTSKLLLTSQIIPFIMQNNCPWLPPLKGLAETEGAQLLQELGIQGSETELQEFTRYLDGHPTLLRFVAAYLGRDTHIREAEKLGLRQLDQLFEEVEGDYRDRQRVRCEHLLALHYERLRPELGQFFLNLSIYQHPRFNRDAAAVVFPAEDASGSPNKIQKALHELTSCSLLEEINLKNEKHYQFPSIVWLYAKQKAGKQPEALRRKVIAYCQSITPDKSTWETLEDLASYLEIFYHYCELKEYTQAFYTIFHSNDYDDCENFLRLRGYNTVRTSLYGQLVQVWQRQLNESEMRAFELALTCLGDAYDNLGQYKLAIDYYRQSLKIASLICDLEGKAGSLINIGLAYISLEDYGRAFKYTYKGVKLALQISHYQFAAHGFNNLGILCCRQEDYELAIKYYEKSIEIKWEYDYYQGDASSVINLGDAYRCLGQHEQAINFLEHGIDIAQQNGHRRFEADGWFNLGFALEDMDQKLAAIAAYQNARELYREMELDEYVQQVSDAIHRLS